jgi:hypothetical protein
MSTSYIDKILASLPSPPPDYEGDDGVWLVLFQRFGSEPVILGDTTVSEADAKLYCSQDACKSQQGTVPGAQWFVGWRAS